MCLGLTSALGFGPWVNSPLILGSAPALTSRGGGGKVSEERHRGNSTAGMSFHLPVSILVLK